MESVAMETGGAEKGATVAMENKKASRPSSFDPALDDMESDNPQSNRGAQQNDLDLLAKLEEANSFADYFVTEKETDKQKDMDPDMKRLVEKKKSAVERLLEADKKLCKALSPGHSRKGSESGPSPILGHSRNGSSVTPSPVLGHSRKGSETSMISTNSTNSNNQISGQITEEEVSNPSGNLWEIWGKLVNDWASARKKPAFVRQLVRRGVPNPFRSLAWQLMLSVNDSPMKDMYVDYLKQKSPSERMIRRDIARTFPEHDFFKEKNGLGQESLFNVMKAYSLHDREVGYCQGSGFIVGLLLMQMPEEEAFAVLVKLMQDYRLRELFKPSMAELGLCMYKLECLIQEILPDLFCHFQTQSFHTSMYASSWFLTLFATVLSLNLSFRVMDLFISEGMDAIFRVGIAILQTSQEELLSMDMEMMIKFFQKDMSQRFDSDPEVLFNTAYQVRYSAKKLKRLEKEYSALKSKENEDQVELRRLRTENRLLRQRIDNLEKESASLADRLIQYQLTRAQEAEETYALKNDLSLTRQKFSDCQHKLKEAQGLLTDIKERTDSITSASSLEEGDAQQIIQNLQEELITVRLKEAENVTTMKNLHAKIQELEEYNTQLQRAPSNDVQCLQEELIAVKLREAEANLSLKEMKQTISDLETNWQKHLASATSSESPKGNKKELNAELKRTQEELMTVKLREAACLARLKDSKQRVMELETQNQICTNQIRRMGEENKLQKSQLEVAADQEKELQKQIKNLLRRIDDIDTKRKEEGMMARIREAENDQIVGELRQKMAEMEIQKEELLTADRLVNKGGTQELENRIFDLQDEVLQLKLSASPKSPNTSISSHAADDEEEEEDLEDEDIEDPESLNRTLSEIIEGKRSSTSLLALLNRDDTDCDSVKSSISENSNASKKVETETKGYDCDRLREDNSSSAINSGEDSVKVKDSEHSQSCESTKASSSCSKQTDQTNNNTLPVVANGEILHSKLLVQKDLQTAENSNSLETVSSDKFQTHHNHGENGNADHSLEVSIVTNQGSNDNLN